MAKQSRGLGKGLDVLIKPSTKNETEPQAGESVNQKTEKKEDGILVKLTMVEPNRKQPRKDFNEDSLQELADSIRQVVTRLIVWIS